jgi:hypothetical protein
MFSLYAQTKRQRFRPQGSIACSRDALMMRRTEIFVEIQNTGKYNNYKGRCAVHIPKAYLETSVFNFVFADMERAALTP